MIYYLKIRTEFVYKEVSKTGIDTVRIYDYNLL
jgi:hypothetical protein